VMCARSPRKGTCLHNEIKHILATISRTGYVECVACGEKLDWYEWAHIHSKKELDRQEPQDYNKEQSTKRLQLLWDIDRLVNDPATTDDEKWDAIRALLDTHQLLLQIGTADEVNECDFCGWFDGKHSPTCKVAWSPVPKCYEL